MGRRSLSRRVVLLGALAGLLTACELEPVRRPTPTPARERSLPPSPTPLPPTATPLPPPTPTPAPPPDPFLTLSGPLVREALRRRDARATADASYARRIDSGLNRDRINFHLLGYGQTYEPPYQDVIGSPTVLSLDLPTRGIDLVSLTHDIRAPEIESYQKRRGLRSDPTKIDRAFDVGGFDLMRLAIEDATGFSVDFQMAMDDRTIATFVDDVMGKMTVDLPFSFDTLPYSIDKEVQPAGHFVAGRNEMTGRRALEFMKAITPTHDRATERNVRKKLVFDAIFAYLQAHATDPFFWFRAVTFTNGEVANGHLQADFDLGGLVLANVGELARGMLALSRGSTGAPLMPHLNQSLYVVDRDSGDGGVEWATLSVNPIARRDVAEGVYPTPYFAVPFSSDPYAADLPSGYWWSVRRLIRDALLGRPMSLVQEAKERQMVEQP